MKCINPNHVNLKEILSNFIKNITYELYSRSTLGKFQKYKQLRPQGGSTGQKVTCANMKAQDIRITPLFSSFKNIVPSPRYRDLKIADFRVYSVF